MLRIESPQNPEVEVELGPAGRPKRQVTKKKVDYSLMVESPKDLGGRNKKKYEEDLESWVEAMIENSKPR